MTSEIGLSLYFKRERIRLKTSMIEAIGNPEYIHLFIDSARKAIYVQACARDKDAFKVYPCKAEGGKVFYIHAKLLLQYLSRLIGTDPSVSLRCSGVSINSDTVLVSLRTFEEIERGQEE